MLPEPEMLFDVETHFLQVSKNLVHVVSEGFVINEASSNSLTDLHPLSLVTAILLLLSAQQRHLGMSHILELRVALVEGIHEVLNLGELELTHSYQPVPGGNFIPEAEANRASTEGDSSSVELKQFVEVDEDTLGGFGTEIAGEVGGGSDFCLEHEVEFFRGRQIVSCIWGLDLELFKDDLHLLLAVVIRADDDLLVLLRLLGLQLALIELVLQPLNQQLVSSVPCTRLDVLHQQV